MQTGEYRTISRIKADAAPVDNVTKFAWDDADYETVEEWHEFTPEELEEKRLVKINAAENLLYKYDYITNKLCDALMFCTTVEEILATLAQFRAEYLETLEQRKGWRDEINELEEGVNDGET